MSRSRHVVRRTWNSTNPPPRPAALDITSISSTCLPERKRLQTTRPVQPIDAVLEHTKQNRFNGESLAMMTMYLPKLQHSVPGPAWYSCSHPGKRWRGWPAMSGHVLAHPAQPWHRSASRRVHRLSASTIFRNHHLHSTSTLPHHGLHS